ncbi:MAG: ligand-binding sensor domain-containing protein [Parvicellaceae bacterium]|jgi:ligand-binding sensor domain-containing protein
MKTLLQNGICLILLATGSFSIQAQVFTNYTTVEGLLSNNVNCVAVDANDDLWFGTQNGVSFFDGTTWTDHTIAIDSGLADNNVVAIYVAADGTVWAGTDFGLSYYNGTSWATYTTIDGLGDDRVNSVTEDAAGDIWIGHSDGASEFTGTVWTSWGTAEGLPFGGVSHIEVHTSGDVYMGGGLGGVQIWDGAVFTEFTELEGLINDKVRSLVIDDSDQKWIGTADGITVMSSTDLFVENHSIMYTLPPPDTLNPVEDVVIDTNGNIWAAIYVDYLVSEGGISMYNGSFWTDYSVADGLIGPVVKQMAVDGQNNIWITTSTGVSKMSSVPSSIAEQKNKGYVIYPNPTSSSFQIKVEKGTMVSISDLTGKLVYSANYQPVEMIDVANWTSGMYIVNVAGNIQKLIIQ